MPPISETQTLFGKVVEGFDIENDLNETTASELHRLLRAHGVLVFRNQAHLSPAGQVRLAKSFGTPYEVPPTMAIVGTETPEVMVLDYRFPIEDADWHSDGTPNPFPPYCTILKAVAVPPSGGDTVWSSMFAAYEGLSPKMREYLAGLTCVHSTANAPEQYLKSLKRETLDDVIMQNTVHPIVVSDIHSGRRALFANKRYSTRILELPLEEGNAILDFLFNHIASPDYHFRLRWEVGTIAIWDNIFTQHCPTRGYVASQRVMHRVAVRSSKAIFAPVSVQRAA